MQLVVRLETCDTQHVQGRFLTKIKGSSEEKPFQLPHHLRVEKHFLFECPALQDLRDRYENLFEALQGDVMILSMWRDDIINVAQFINACLRSVHISWPSPVQVGNDVTWPSLLYLGLKTPDRCVQL